MPSNVENDVDTLLRPVDLGSFALSTEAPSRNIFAGIPSIDKSKMWDFALTEDGKGERVLSFLVDNKTINFRLGQHKDGSPISATRLPDSESDDFGLGGQARKGRAQIHKAGPKRILGTFQTGKNNMTFEMSKGDEGEHSWSVTSRKDPDATVATFVQRVLEKKGEDSPELRAVMKGIRSKILPTTQYGDILPSVGPVTNEKPLDKVMQGIDKLTVKPNSQNPTVLPEHGGIFANLKERLLKTKIPVPSMDTLSYPITGDLAGGLAVSAGLGAGLMGIKNLLQRVTGREHGSLIKDLLLGAGGGAAASGLVRMFDSGMKASVGEVPGAKPNMAQQRNRKTFGMYSGNMLPGAHLIKPPKRPGEKNYWEMLDDLKLMKANDANNKAASEKSAFLTGNSTVDMIALQSILGADPTITAYERRALLGQAQMAMGSSRDSAVSVSDMQARGLGMLAGYVMSKMMGFGGLGTIASVALGGMVGGNMANHYGPMWNSKGYYEY